MKYKNFRIGFWHPFGPHSDESAEHILMRKTKEAERNGWTLWSFQPRQTLLEWYRQIKITNPKKVFVFCSAGNGKDPVENGSPAINCSSYRFINNEKWFSIPKRIRVGHPFRSGKGNASAFIVQKVIHPINSFDPPAVEWLSKEGNWQQGYQSKKGWVPRLPSRPEYLVRPGGTAKMGQVRAILELKSPYLAVVSTDLYE